MYYFNNICFIKKILIILIPLIIGMIIGYFYKKKWNEYKYKNLKKPKYYPPNYIFSIIWPILYLLIGIVYSNALYEKNCQKKKVKYWIIPFLSLIFNYAYIPVFFSKNGYINSFIIIILSLIFAIFTLLQFYLQKINNIILILYIPYIIWLIYASYLSYKIYILNS